jgi:putative sigma-54 modulation protein
MKVNVHAVNFNVDGKLVDFVQDRMDKLEKYYDKVVSADVYLKVEKTSDKENKIVEESKCPGMILWLKTMQNF